MSDSAAPAAVPQRSRRGWAIGAGIALLFVFMALDTTVISLDEVAQDDGFSPERFGAQQFPIVQAFVRGRAIEAGELATAIAADKQAAAEAHGVAAGIGAVMPVSLSGTLGEAKAGVFEVAVDGLEDGPRVRVQMGPAINGTDLRDATGEIAFGQFTNQIEYQDAGSAINQALKDSVLASIDTDTLTGRRVALTGVFKLISPKNWLITPVEVAFP